MFSKHVNVRGFRNIKNIAPTVRQEHCSVTIDKNDQHSTHGLIYEETSVYSRSEVGLIDEGV